MNSYPGLIDSFFDFWLNAHMPAKRTGIITGTDGGIGAGLVEGFLRRRTLVVGSKYDGRGFFGEKESTMEGVAVRDTAGHVQDHSDLREAGAGAIVFPWPESPGSEETAEWQHQSVDWDLSLEDEIDEERGFREIVGNNTGLKTVLENVRMVAPADSSVLILGETGTGKELIARAIHDLSPRKNYPLVKVNCASIPSGLLESELFGHERGAFTGAIAQKVGRFELANKGTLFLDEVGDIALELQPKLLRVLQEQEFERLGSTRTQRVDVRMVAATNADLRIMVAEKKFRSDLYYRLNVFPIALPPLRERPDDIGRLVRHFARKYAQRMGKRITNVPRATMEALTHYTWPGNVRELQNLMERAVLLSKGPSLRVPLTDILMDCNLNASPDSNVLEQAERELILRALRESNWVIGGTRGAATRLRLNRTGLQYKIKKFGITRPS
jgi:formate hydrogenlyase transcriptional activator